MASFCLSLRIRIPTICIIAVLFPLSMADATGFKVLYAFRGGEDGDYPRAALYRDRDANLYGTTEAGGGSTKCFGGCGTVFKLGPDGTETVLYRFSGGSDGGPQIPR